MFCCPSHGRTGAETYNGLACGRSFWPRATALGASFFCSGAALGRSSSACTKTLGHLTASCVVVHGGPVIFYASTPGHSSPPCAAARGHPFASSSVTRGRSTLSPAGSCLLPHLLLRCYSRALLYSGTCRCSPASCAAACRRSVAFGIPTRWRLASFSTVAHGYFSHSHSAVRGCRSALLANAWGALSGLSLRGPWALPHSALLPMLLLVDAPCVPRCFSWTLLGVPRPTFLNALPHPVLRLVISPSLVVPLPCAALLYLPSASRGRFFVYCIPPLDAPLRSVPLRVHTVGGWAGFTLPTLSPNPLTQGNTRSFAVCVLTS